MAGRRQPYTEQEHGERLAEQAWRDKLAEAAREHQDFRLGPIDEGINEGKAALEAWLMNLVQQYIGRPDVAAPEMRSPQPARPVEGGSSNYPGIRRR
jgi:hypothetical protein